jgi:hypothetical protein
LYILAPVGQPILAAAGFQPAPEVSTFLKPVRPTGSAGGLAAGVGQALSPANPPPENQRLEFVHSGACGAANPGCRRLSAGAWSLYIFQARKATGSAGGLAAGVGQALSPANPPPENRRFKREAPVPHLILVLQWYLRA